MSFLSGFLAAWDAADQREERRREFEREMALRAQSMIWPQVFEEMTKVNEIKARQAEKFAAARMAGLSKEATLVLQANGELDGILARIDKLGDKYNAQWAKDYSDLIDEAVDNETELGIAVKALIESAEKDGTDVPADLTWARIQASLMETQTPEEAFDLAERLSRTIGDWKSEVSRVPRFATDIETPEYSVGAMQLIDSTERQRIQNQVEDALGAVGEGQWVVEGDRRRWAATDDAGYQRLLNTLTQEVMDQAREGTGDTTSAIQDVTSKVVEERAANPNMSPSDLYGTLYVPDFKSNYGSTETEEAATVPPINTQQEPSFGNTASDNVANVADTIIAGGGQDSTGQSFSSGNEQEDEDKNPSAFRVIR